MTNRFFIPPEVIKNDQFEITDSGLVHQMTKVLRFKPGEILELLDNTGNVYTAEVSVINKKSVKGLIQSVLNVPDRPKHEINLCISLLKGSRLDCVFQKATELGVSSFTPIITTNCVKRTEQVSDRWLKIVQESAEQCGRSQMPVINPVIDFLEALEQYPHGFICYEPAGTKLPEVKIKPGQLLNVYIGPEGDFTEKELSAAMQKKLEPINLGSNRLRAETAAITAVALLSL